MGKICYFVDNISKLLAKISSYIVLALIISINYEVFVRYFLNSPTMWSYAVSFMLGASMYALGLADVFRTDDNVKVDLFYIKFPKKVKLLINIIFGIIFAIPTVYIIIDKFWEDALMSFEFKETFLAYTPWQGAISWPMKMTITLGFTWLFIQILINLLRDIDQLRKIWKR